MFTPSKMLSNYLNAQPRDMYDIVGALMGYINADPQFKTNDFDLAVHYVLDHGVHRDELFAPFNAEIDFESDQTKWNEEYYSFARVYLKDNFCEKRIHHVKAVAKKLYPMPVLSGGAQSNGKKAQSQQYHQPVEKPQRSKATNIIIVAAAVVLLALLVVALGK